MGKWKQLDLTRKQGHPAPGQLVALRLTRKNDDRHLYCEQYDIGRFSQEDGGRKLWWRGARGCEDPARMKKHNDIWWCPVHEFDGAPG